MKQNKYTIELTEEQLLLIANCVEDCHRFAAGQCELYNTNLYFDNCCEVRDILQEKVEPLVAPNGRGSSYGWSGRSCQNKFQRKFIAETYGIYREILHQYTVANGIDNVYSSPTLRCEEQGEPIKVRKL